MKRAVALLFAVVLVLTACGDDDGGRGALSSDDQKIAEDLTQEILGDSSSDVPFTDQQAACFAKGLVGALGGDVMVDALQMEFEEFMTQATPDQRMTVVDTMLDCVDFGAMMAAELGGQISQESATCIGDAFTDSDAFRAALAASFDGSGADPFEDDALMADVLPAMLSCLTAEELAELGGAGS